MVSFLRVDSFRDKLRSVCERGAFRGEVKDNSFTITSGSIFPTSYTIKGTFSADENMTVVNFSVSYNKIEHLLFRWRGKKLERLFVDEMDIAPNSKEQ